jgi:aspartate beta-hydroxylase
MMRAMDGAPSDLDTLLASARAKAAAGKLDAAVAAWKRVAERDPGCVEAHAFLVPALLKRGDAAAAVRHGERAIAARPEDPALHHQLAGAHLALLKGPSAEKHLAAIVAEQPGAFTSLLHLARLLEVRGSMRDALVGYTRAIKTARARGFWHSEDATPPWLVTAVAHATRFSRDGRLAFFHDWLSPMVLKHGRDEMKRVAECLAMWLGEKPLVIADPRQKPSFLYFPGLPVSPVFRRESLSFAEAYEAQWEVIRDEMLAVLDDGREVQPFHFDVPEERRGALTRGAWDAYFFYDEGDRLDAHHAACPRTSAAIDALPLDRVRQHGPEMCFSVLRPGAHILPHRGVTNTRSVLHMGLVVPRDCALNLVGVEEVTWSEGRCWAFDDTYEHEAWNRSDTTRVVLLGDIWNPHLTLPERDAIADLVGTIGDFNRATAATPV